MERGITNGTDETHFSPGATVTRAQTVTFLWRASDRPAANGTDKTHFSPASDCTRAQIVTLLYRDLGL